MLALLVISPSTAPSADPTAWLSTSVRVSHLASAQLARPHSAPTKTAPLSITLLSAKTLKIQPTTPPAPSPSTLDKRKSPSTPPRSSQDPKSSLPSAETIRQPPVTGLMALSTANPSTSISICQWPPKSPLTGGL